MAGPWTSEVARLSAKGGLEVTGKGKAKLADVYTVVLSRGTRPAPGKFGIPDYGDAYSAESGEGDDFENLCVTNIAFSQPDPTSNVWEATVTYEKRGTSISTGEGEPEGEWTRAIVGFESYQEELTTDSDGTPVVNSAGDAFENAPNIDRDLLSIQLEKTCRNSPVSIVSSLNGTINESAVSVLGVSIAARTGRVKLEAEHLFGTKANWRLSIRIVVNPDTWDLKVLQNGYRYMDGGNLVKFTELTADGKVVECSTPQLLGPEGGDGRGRGPYYAEFKPYPAASWTQLNLPDSVGGSSSSSTSSTSNEQEEDE